MEFQWGTDVDKPLQRSLKKCLDEPAGHTADVAIISDRDYDISPQTVQLVNDCRERKGHEVSALLIEGSSGASTAICDESRIHKRPNWSSLR